MKKLLPSKVIFLLLFMLTSCSNSGGGTCAGTEPHALEDNWLGFSGIGPMNLVINASGDILQISGGYPLDVHATLSEEVPGIFHADFVSSGSTISIPGKLLTDDSASHAGFIYGGFYYIALERSAIVDRLFAYEDSDLIGTWSGHGYAYNVTNAAFEKIEPVEVIASLTITGTSYQGTLPAGTINGEIDSFDADAGFWQGTGVSGARIEISMSPDKEFVAVRSIPLGATEVEELFFFALTRQ